MGMLIRLQHIYNFLLFHVVIFYFGCLMGFIIHFYIIFGTNLLTGGPVPVAFFLPISVFRRKGISNGIQTERNLREDLSWTKSNPEDLELKSGTLRGSHEAGGRAQGVGTPPASWTPCWLLDVHSKSPGSRLFQK